MLIDGLPTATLLGTNGESLAIQICCRNDGGCHEFAAKLNSPNGVLQISQSIHTDLYDMDTRDIHNLTDLLAGGSSARFQLTPVRFDLSIYEHTWGVRSGFVAEMYFSTIAQIDHAPWPKHPIGDHLLDDDPSAACLRFAFVCDHECLADFTRQLTAMYRQLSG